MPNKEDPARLKQHGMGGATLAAVPFMAADFTRAAEAFASGHPVIGFVQTGMGAFDWVFFRAFQQTFVDTYRANHGLGETTRQNWLLTGINKPLKGAEIEPKDPSKPRLVNRGFLKTLSPALVLMVGMDGRVVLGWAAPWDDKNRQDTTEPMAAKADAIPFPGGWLDHPQWFDKAGQQTPKVQGSLLEYTPQQFADALQELGFPRLPHPRRRRLTS